MATHRPRLIVRFIQATHPIDNEKPKAYVTISNVGETDAIVIAFGADIAKRGGYAWEPPGLFASLQELGNTKTIKNGERHTFTIEAHAETTANDIQMIHRNVLQLCLVGEIKYTDNLGIIRHTGFYRNYNWARRRYLHATDKADIEEYEYAE